MRTSKTVAIMSPLSDAQEAMVRGLYYMASRNINYAKFLMIKLLDEEEQVDSERLDQLREEFNEQFPETR